MAAGGLNRSSGHRADPRVSALIDAYDTTPDTRQLFLWGVGEHLLMLSPSKDAADLLVVQNPQLCLPMSWPVSVASS